MESGIDYIADVPRGTHLAHFYRTQDDILEIMVPYFREGLRQHELCIWIAAEPLGVTHAASALREAVPNLDEYIRQGQIEIADDSNWYGRSQPFDSAAMARQWIDREQAALDRGYDGIRVNGNAFSLQKSDWNEFCKYEATINDSCFGRHVRCICSYPAQMCDSSELIQVAVNHQFALIKQDNRWQVVETREMRRNEAALLESERRFHRLVQEAIDALPDHIAILDDRAKIIIVNDAWRRFADANGFQGSNYALGDNYLEVCDSATGLYADEAECVAAGIRRLLDQKTGELRCEYPCHDTSTKRWFQLRARFFQEADQSHVLLAHGNVTEIKLAEEEVLRLSERLQGTNHDLQAARDSAERAKAVAEQASRAKDHFLAVLSHELRTPLTPVVLGLSMLRERTDLDPEVREMLEMVRRNVELETLLIDDLLDVTRIVRGKIELQKQRVELSTIIRRAVEVCKPDIEARRLHFGVDLGPAAPYWVEADVARLQQVFWNLLKNAIKFTPPGGCVGVRCRPTEQDVVVEVNDSGIGLDPESLSRVFNAFEQAERSITRQFGGLGLGLAISKAIVEMHGGKIEVQSEGRGRGATFRIRLPLCEPAVQPETLTPAPPPPHAVRRLHILLVEDHGVTAKMMRMVLTAEGHAVETAGDVATALEVADQENFDLLISDLGLPDGSGHDLMRQLRKRGHTLPGIALSGYGQEEDIQRSRDAGFVAHLTKPASRETVVGAVASATAKELTTSH